MQERKTYQERKTDQARACAIIDIAKFPRETGAMKHTKTQKTDFEKELERFFTTRSTDQQKRVEADPRYQEAAKRFDAVKAQEIAASMLEGDATGRNVFRGQIMWLLLKDQ